MFPHDDKSHRNFRTNQVYEWKIYYSTEKKTIHSFDHTQHQTSSDFKCSMKTLSHQKQREHTHTHTITA